MKLKSKRAQTTLEYAALVGIIASALIAMSVYVQRAVQANLKVIEQAIEEQPQ